MSFIPLSRLLSEGRDAAAPFALLAGRTIDFGAFARAVAWNAARLRAIGCRRGLLVAGDSYWGAVGMLALLHVGAKVILPQTLQPGVQDRFGADCIVSDEAVPTGALALPHHRLAAGEGEPGRLDAPDPDAASFELYTAGSTGQAKSVTKTMADMEAEAAEIYATLGASLVPATVFATVPYHHLYGLSFRLVLPLCAGWPIVAKTYQYWEALAGEITQDAILVTSPAHLTRMPDLEIPAARRPQRVLSAGAALSDQAARAAAAVLGVPVTDIFGSTETGVIAYRQRIGNAVPWQAFPGVETRRLEDGRLAVRSRHISQGTKDGWFETADLIAADEDGAFVLQGRADRILKIEGNRVSLAEIEHALHQSDLVETAAVVALGTDSMTLGAAIVLTLEGWQALTERGAFRLGQELKRDLGRNFEPTGLPRRWRFLDRLPEAVLGKRRKDEIAALFGEGDAPKNPEVKALRQIEGGVELDLFLPATLLALRGHFKDMPIVPGVALIDWVVGYAAEHLEAPSDAGQAFQIKFRRVITAPSRVTLILLNQPRLRRIQFEYRQGDNVLSSGALKLQDQDRR
jgi:AMP-binding enzyme